MQIEVEELGAATVLRLQGKLDSLTSTDFETAVGDAVENGSGGLLVDLGQLQFMASAGLRVLLGAVKRLTRENRPLRVFGLNGLVRDTFEISGFVSIIDVRANEAEAREGLV